jgi:hypothetical protein
MILMGKRSGLLKRYREAAPILIFSHLEQQPLSPFQASVAHPPTLAAESSKTHARMSITSLAIGPMRLVGQTSWKIRDQVSQWHRGRFVQLPYEMPRPVALLITS